MVVRVQGASVVDSAAPIEIGTLAETVADRIRTAIVHGELKPGERLGEQRWARALGVSRGPVREAAQLLTARGLLVQHPRRGFFVRSFSIGEIDELYDLRLALERHALRKIVEEGAVEAVTQALAAQIEVMAQAVENRQLERLAEADLAFHRIGISYAGSGRLLAAFDELAVELLILTPRLDLLREDPDLLVEGHRPLIDAIQRLDLNGVLQLIDRHLGDARDDMIEHFSDQAGAEA